MVDKGLIIIAFTSLVFCWLVLAEAKTAFPIKLFSKAIEKPTRGGYSARLKLVFDSPSKRLIRTENINVARYFYTGGPSGFIFIVFEKPVGLETIALRHNDGKKLLYEVEDVSQSSIVIRLKSALNDSGLLFACGNDPDLMKPTIGADRTRQSLPAPEKEMPR